MAGFDLSTLLPFMMGGGKNLNPQDLMAMMMRGGSGGSAPPPNQNPFGAAGGAAGGDNFQLQLILQIMSMMNRPKAPPPVGFRPIEGICPCLPLFQGFFKRR